ncbi:uncharacterized protein LOC134686990 isoform X2 [Mytilus trossulus]|uniref:uncharacterized protein LOC134686990 isoform X2 n=1 Tax=Mytilus trossulus TaxID=6551 RepID=UPI0030048C27
MTFESKMRPETEYSQPDRPCPRWGEQDDIEHGRNYRTTDGYSKFRSNFAACHELPVEHEVKNLEGFAYPKPFEVDMRSRVKDLPAPTRRVERGEHLEMFPKHDPSRQNGLGQHRLSEATRNSLETTRGKLYEKSRYQILLPGKYQSNKENTEIQLFNINRTLCPKTHQHEDPPKDDHLEINDTEVRHSCFRVDDFNQNFPFVLSSIYNYRLPSSLHQPDDHLQEDYLSLLKLQEMADKKEVLHPQRIFHRPTVPDKIGVFMDSVKTEMNICEYDKTHQETVSESVVREIPEPCVGEWENSSVLYKLKLSDKAGTQQRYHSSHEDPLPDLRDNGKYSKRVNFYGFNSSAFRG